MYLKCCNHYGKKYDSFIKDGLCPRFFFLSVLIGGKGNRVSITALPFSTKSLRGNYILNIFLCCGLIYIFFVPFLDFHNSLSLSV